MSLVHVLLLAKYEKHQGLKNDQHAVSSWLKKKMYFGPIPWVVGISAIVWGCWAPGLMIPPVVMSSVFEPVRSMNVVPTK